MAYTTIDDPSAYFHVNLHSGNGTNNTDITFDANAGDFQPDWIWFKGRTSSAIDHALFDSSRGTTKILNSNNENTENAQGATLKAFNSNGFRVGDDAGDYGVNASGRTYVTWSWKCNGGSTSSNTDGSITSTVQANTTAGFSIVTYTGTGSNATVGHGLGSAPNWLIVKSRGNADPWHNLVDDIGADETLEFNTFNMGTGIWNNTRPTSTVFSIGTNDGVNRSSGTFVAYCFAEKQGYSKFGSYTGNGNVDGTFVYTGFKPAWIMMKNISSNGNSWNILDNKRDPFNVMDTQLLADGNDVDQDYDWMDFLSNGFKLRRNSTQNNADGSSYIYMAFAEHPFVSSEGVPTTAR